MNGEMLRIMLVEDDDDHAELVRRSLAINMVANALLHLRDGEEAIRFLQRQCEKDTTGSNLPNLILLDLRLPRMDGFEVLSRIKSEERLCHIPVVILTSSEAEKDIARAYANHAGSYLVKPVAFEQFSRMMRDMGYYWLGWNRYPFNPKPDNGTSWPNDPSS